MARHVGIFLIFCAGACAILQVGHGQVSVESCVFPFTYEGSTYFDCTHHGSAYSWCSLEATYSGKWKYCTKDDRAPCVFPFNYNGKVYKRCTTDGSMLKKAWCSLTKNYDKDGAWKNCYD